LPYHGIQSRSSLYQQWSDGFRFSAVVAIAEKFSGSIYSDKVAHLSQNGRFGSPHSFQSNGDKPHQYLPSVDQKTKEYINTNQRHDLDSKE
jgi:hypothetical protein